MIHTMILVRNLLLLIVLCQPISSLESTEDMDAVMDDVNELQLSDEPSVFSEEEREPVFSPFNSFANDTGIRARSLSTLLNVNGNTYDAVVPVNTEVRNGQKAVLNCQLFNPELIVWTFYSKISGPQVIAVSCYIVQSVVGSYRVDKTTNACNLVIDRVTVNHLGTYTCQDFTLQSRGHSVELSNSKENLALHKHAVQSSTYVAASLANLAVDGRKTFTGLVHNNCAITQSSARSWWAVDLGQLTSISRVRITGRHDGVFSQLSNFFIGLTNQSPWSHPPPQLSQSSICKYFFGIPPPGIPLDIFCEPNTAPGRYLFVMKHESNHLTICELEAYYK